MTYIWRQGRHESWVTDVSWSHHAALATKLLVRLLLRRTHWLPASHNALQKPKAMWATSAHDN